MKIVIKEIPSVADIRLPEWVSKSLIGLELETMEYGYPWIRFGDPDLSLNDENFYTVRVKDLFLVLNGKNAIAANYLGLQFSSEIKSFLFEKKFCDEIPS